MTTYKAPVLDSNGHISAGAMQPYVDRFTVAKSTTYSPGDIILYQGRRILATKAFTTGTDGTYEPFISAANYVRLGSYDRWHAADYGVSGDGVTDNGATLNNLIGRVSANGGGVIELPAGFIMTSVPIIVQPMVHLWGQGIGNPGTQIKLTAAANCDVVQFSTFNSSSQAAILGTAAGNIKNAFYAGLHDLTIHGGYSSQTPGTYHHGVNATTNPVSSTASGDPDFDPKNILENVYMRSCTGDGYFHSGRSDMRLVNCISMYNGGNGYSLSFDTHAVNCIAGQNGVAGFWSNFASVQIVGCKSYNNGHNPWSGTTAWAATSIVFYNGALYAAINTVTSTTTPDVDTANWAPVTGTDASAWGSGYHIATNGGETTIAGCDAQQNSGSSFVVKQSGTKSGITIIGCTSAQPNFVQSSSSAATTNPNSYAALVLDNARGVIASISSTSAGSVGYQLRMVNGTTHCDLTLAGDTTAAAVLTPDSPSGAALLSSGNSVRWNGASLTAALSSLADVDLTGLTDGQVLAWNAATSKWKPVNN